MSAAIACLPAQATPPAKIPVATAISTCTGTAAQNPAAADLSRAPLRFEENLGQIDAAATFVTRGADSTVFLTQDEVVTSLRTERSTPAVVRMRFRGSKGASAVVGEARVEATTHYYVGTDAARWQRNVPNFAKVRYRDVYAGIDVVYHGTGGRLEYDFALAPGADPRQIDLTFSGVDDLHIDRDGDLVMQTPAGVVVHKRPAAFQDEGTRPVAARYVMRRHGGLGISLAKYDRSKPLVIDPFVAFYSTYLGGSVADKILGLAVDSAGNAYVAGLTQSIDFPTANAAQPAQRGETDVFVSKINAAGNALVYSTYLGGSELDAATGITRDASGNVYVTGYTESPDFPTTPNALKANLSSVARDAFVVKLGTDGALQYSTYLGGSNLDAANAIAVDGAGDAYVTGFTCSPDFPVANAFQPLLNGAANGCFAGRDAFVSKLDAGGTALIYSTYFGGSATDEANGIAVDSQGRAAITGYTGSADFPTAGIPLSAYQGSADTFISRFDATGGLDYSTYFGGTAHDEGATISIDTTGNFYVAGFTQSSDFPTVNAFQGNLNGPEDGFIAKLAVTSTTATVAYSTYLGGGDADRVRAIALDGNGSAHVTGFTASADFPLMPAAQSMLNGTQDAFVARISPVGALTYSRYLGGDGVDDGWGIGLVNGRTKTASYIYVAGLTDSTDLSTPGAVQQNPQGSFDGFVERLISVP